MPHVLTAHSLEPLRPWKAEQLGGGYQVSLWVERTAVQAADAVIAVSSGMREDVLTAYPALNADRVHVVKNGVDTSVWYPGPTEAGESIIDELGVDRSRPIVAFVGRITRQKGVPHLIAAAHKFDPGVQLVLCAGAPDTPEIGAEVKAAVDDPTVSQKLLDNGMVPAFADSAALKKTMEENRRNYREVIRAANIKAE
jgi:starch synthase